LYIHGSQNVTLHLLLLSAVPESDLYILLISVTISTSEPLGSSTSALVLCIIFYVTSLSSVSTLLDRSYFSTYIWNLQTDTPSHFWHVFQSRRDVTYGGNRLTWVEQISGLSRG